MPLSGSAIFHSVFGVATPTDPGRIVVARLIEDLPDLRHPRVVAVHVDALVETRILAFHVGRHAVPQSFGVTATPRLVKALGFQRTLLGLFQRLRDELALLDRIPDMAYRFSLPSPSRRPGGAAHE